MTESEKEEDKGPHLTPYLFLFFKGMSFSYLILALLFSIACKQQNQILFCKIKHQPVIKIFFYDHNNNIKTNY